MPLPSLPRLSSGGLYTGKSKTRVPAPQPAQPRIASLVGKQPKTRNIPSPVTGKGMGLRAMPVSPGRRERSEGKRELRGAIK
jgi:hypothetical protein